LFQLRCSALHAGDYAVSDHVLLRTSVAALLARRKNDQTGVVVFFKKLKKARGLQINQIGHGAHTVEDGIGVVKRRSERDGVKKFHKNYLTGG
jgi:hypothetical protein